MRKALSFVLIAILSFSLTGCATIINKDVFPLTINSNPDNANITVQDEKGTKVYSGTTPATVTLTAGESYFHAKSYHITFSKPGYADQYADVKATLSGWYICNILFGGLIGMLIFDPITGKMWKLPPDVVIGNLSQKIALNQNQSTLHIVTLSQVPQNLRDKLVSLN